MDLMNQRHHRLEAHNHDHKGVIVVAGAWVLFYGLLLGGFAVTKGADVLASLY